MFFQCKRLIENNIHAGTCKAIAACIQPAELHMIQRIEELFSVNCSKCGHRNPDENRYCGMCGAGLDRPGAPDTELLPEDSEPSFFAGHRETEAVSSTVAERPARTEAPPALERPAPAFVLNDARPENSAGANDRFVGLSLGQSEYTGSGDTDYLLEEVRGGGAGKWLLLILVIIGGLAYAQYRANQRGSTLFAGLPTIAAPRPAKPAPPVPAGQNQNPGQPEMTVSPNNEKLKAEQEAAKLAEAKPTPSDQAKGEIFGEKGGEKGGDKNTRADATKKNADTKSAATNEDQDTKPKQMAKADQPAKPEADANSDDEQTTPAAKSKPKAATSSKPVKQRDPGTDQLEEGLHYLYGQGGAKSCSRAVNLIHEAANQGNAKARAQLGGMYATGNCLSYDRATAYRWFSLALQADPHNRVFERDRQMLWREMDEQERSRVQHAGLE
jgi:hypothetical protein